MEELVERLAALFPELACYCRQCEAGAITLRLSRGRREVEIEVAVALVELGPPDLLAAEIARHASAALRPQPARPARSASTITRKSRRSSQ